MPSSARDTHLRHCVRSVLCWLAFPLAPALGPGVAVGVGAAAVGAAALGAAAAGAYYGPGYYAPRYYAPPADTIPIHRATRTEPGAAATPTRWPLVTFEEDSARSALQSRLKPERGQKFPGDHSRIRQGVANWRRTGIRGWSMSALPRFADSSRTSRHFRKVAKLGHPHGP